MAMAKLLVLLFFAMSILLFALTIAQKDPLYHVCAVTGNFTDESDYQSNLDQVLRDLPLHSVGNNNKGFYTHSYGQNSDEVNAISLCRGDRKLRTCQSCVETSRNVLRKLCPNQKEAVIWYEDCLLRYSDRYIFGSMEFGPYFWMYSLYNVTNPSEFHNTITNFLTSLSKKAASGDGEKKFSVGNTITVNSSQTIYALVQCTPDMTYDQCSNCLSQAIDRIHECCYARNGGRVISPSCQFRYEKGRFYDLA